MIELNEEVDGAEIGSRNYRFAKIGKPVSINNSEFDSESPPSLPLSISQRFRLLFAAHSEGFCVARVQEVKALAKKSEDDEECQTTIRDLSIVDVPAGKVSILALSPDDSVLAAIVHHHIHFYAVSSLLHKEQKPSYSVSAVDSSYIVDMRWAQLSVKEYVVLSHDGKLYQGCGQSPLKDIMDNVDAVEWSEKGDSVAVAKKNVLTIFSPEFKEKHSFLLSFKSVVGDSDANSVIKVNCIRWVRSDCIIVGCLQLNDEGEEENYSIQVITGEGGDINDVSSVPTVLSFYNIFQDYQVDVVPRASGPHLSLQYFDRQQLAFVANRKNLSQHIKLFGWGLSGKRNEASVIEILHDNWEPKIELQENGDDNIVLGLSIYQVLENGDTRYVLGELQTEVPPCCNLLGLTIDGKLSVFDFASAAEASDSVEIFDSHEEDDSTLEVPSRQGSAEISTGWGDSEADTYANVGTPISNSNELVVSTESAKAATSDQSSSLFNQEKKPTQMTQTQERDAHQTSKTTSKMSQTGHATELNNRTTNDARSPSLFSSLGAFPSDQSSTQMTQTQERDAHQTSKTTSKMSQIGHATELNNRTTNDARSPLFSSLSAFPSDQSSTQMTQTQEREAHQTSKTTSKMSQIGHTTELPKNMATNDARSGSLFSLSSAFASPYQDPSYFKKADSTQGNSSSRMPISGAVNIRPSVALTRTQEPPQQKIAPGSFSKDHQFPILSSTRVQSSGDNSLKQYQNIEEMVKKLDNLFEDIEGKGGFVDASMACQESSVIALEEKIHVVSRRCREWKVTVDEQISEMQDLLDKTVQVLSRKIYMEGIFKQACDTRYWDLWNRQKLSSELDLKRRHIVEANKELTNQLIELERHFNNLELNRFGDSGGPQLDRRTSRKWHGQSRHIQSLQSLHTTTDAQLIAAEQLSENLLKQMAMLNIESPAKKQTIKKELFDTIGLSYDASSYNSPGKEKITATPLNKQQLSVSGATIDRTRRHRNSLSNTHEPETARRRRDSLDQNWVNVVPPRTTVKRIVLHEDRDGLRGNRSPFLLDRQHISTPLSRRMVDAHSKSSSVPQNHLKGNGIPDIRDQYRNRSPSNALCEWANPVPNTMVSEMSSHTALLSTASAGQIRAEIAGLTNEKLNHELPTKTIGSFMLGESNPIQQSRRNLHEAQFSSSRLPVQTLGITKTMMENSDKNTSFSYTKGSDLVSQISSFPPTSSKVPSSPASNVLLDSKISWKVPDVASTNQSQHVEPTSSDSPSLTARDFPPANLTSLPNQSESVSFGEQSPISKTSVTANQRTAESQTLVSSTLTFPTTFSFLTPASTVESSTSIGQPTEIFSSKSKFMPVENTSLASLPSPSDALESGRMDTSKTSLASGFIRKVDSSADVPGSEKGEVSPKQTLSANAKGNGFITIAATQKSEVLPAVDGSEKVSELSTATLEQGTSIRTSSDVSLAATMNPTSDVLSNAKAATPPDVGIPSLIESSNFGSFNGSNNVISSVFTQEDEMEEEAPETSQVTELSSGFLRGFGSGSLPNPNSGHAIPNPFGPQMINPATPPSSTFTMPPPSGELFRPPSFNFSSLQPAQPSQSTGYGSFSGGFNGGAAGQPSPASGFGKPAQIGSGQQALGSVLGSFGQSRQLGAGLPGTGIASPGGFSSHSSGGFGSGFGGVSSTSGGFSNLASGVGGFAAAATGPGGFAATATAPGGFAAAATAPGGFAAAATAGGGFVSSPNSGAPFSGGFGAFGGQQGGGGFSAFSGSTGTGRPPSELFTQIRK